jgi:hypothetical protein
MCRSPHSHSIVFSHRNALIFQRKSFLHTTKNRFADPSKIRAVDFKSRFQGSANSSITTAIDIDRSIFRNLGDEKPYQPGRKKTVSCAGCNNRPRAPSKPPGAQSHFAADRTDKSYPSSRRRISSSLTSSIVLLSIQRCPLGSATRPSRLPQGRSAIAIIRFAPAATILSALRSGSSTVR